MRLCCVALALVLSLTHTKTHSVSIAIYTILSLPCFRIWFVPHSHIVLTSFSGNLKRLFADSVWLFFSSTVCVPFGSHELLAVAATIVCRQSSSMVSSQYHTAIGKSQPQISFTLILDRWGWPHARWHLNRVSLCVCVCIFVCFNFNFQQCTENVCKFLLAEFVFVFFFFGRM